MAHCIPRTATLIGLTTLPSLEGELLARDVMWMELLMCLCVYFIVDGVCDVVHVL